MPAAHRITRLFIDPPPYPSPRWGREGLLREWPRVCGSQEADGEGQEAQAERRGHQLRDPEEAQLRVGAIHQRQRDGEEEDLPYVEGGRDGEGRRGGRDG